VLTKAEKKTKNSNVVKYETVFYVNILIYSCDAKLNFSASLLKCHM